MELNHTFAPSWLFFNLILILQFERQQTLHSYFFLIRYIQHFLLFIELFHLGYCFSFLFPQKLGYKKWSIFLFTPLLYLDDLQRKQQWYFGIIYLLL